MIENKYIRYLIIIEIAILIYFYVVPFSHETGHFLICIATNSEVQRMVVTVPLWSGESFVTCVPANDAIREIIMIGGVLFDFLIAIILSLFSYFSSIFFIFSLAFYFDGLLYIPYSSITGYGDFVYVSLEFCFIFFVIELATVILMFYYHLKLKKRKNRGVMI